MYPARALCNTNTTRFVSIGWFYKRSKVLEVTKTVLQLVYDVGRIDNPNNSMTLLCSRLYAHQFVPIRQVSGMPNGDTFETVLDDNLSPLEPNPKVQIRALFQLMPIVYEL